MAQDHVFSSAYLHNQQPIYEQNMYPNDISLQFASSVPQRPQYSVHFQNSFQNTENPHLPLNRGLNFGNFEQSELPKQQQAKADKRAEHNATERARRENLNAKFQQLAHNLPNLQNDSRNSKSAIIDRTLDYINNSVMKEEYMQTRIKELERINHLLMSQLDKQTKSRDVSPEYDYSKTSLIYYPDTTKKKLEEPTFSFIDQPHFN